MAYFMDYFIGAMQRRRGENCARVAESWPIVDAAITELKGGQGHLRPSLVYSYAVNGEARYGSCAGDPIRVVQIEEMRSAVDANSALRVRYDPADPGMSRVLNRDNPWLPFEVDQLIVLPANRK